MQREELLAKYLRLNAEFENRNNAMIREATNRINQQVETAIQRELNAMESALRIDALTEAAYYRMRAEMLFNSLL